MNDYRMNNITVNQFLEYIQFLVASVDKQLETEDNPSVKILLSKLHTLLKSDAISKLLNSLSRHKVNVSAWKEVAEIGDSLDELHIMRLKLPYPNEHFALNRKKQENAQRTALSLLILGLCGFEWELD